MRLRPASLFAFPMKGEEGGAFFLRQCHSIPTLVSNRLRTAPVNDAVRIFELVKMSS